MHTALAAGNVKPGDEVIVTPLTMSSTSLCVLHNGSIPVFADVNPQTFNIDPNSIRKLINKKQKLLLPFHYMDSQQIAKRFMTYVKKIIFFLLKIMLNHLCQYIMVNH